jgi:hypothetical protein
MSRDARQGDGEQQHPLLWGGLAAAAGVLLVLLLTGIGILLQQRADRDEVAVAAVESPSPLPTATPIPRVAGTVVIGTPPGASRPPTGAAAGIESLPTPANTPGTVTPAPTGPAGPTVVVANTGGDGARLRREPSPTSPIIAILAEGARLEQIGPDRDGGGRSWRNVRDAAGNQGWIAADLTRPSS